MHSEHDEEVNWIGINNEYEYWRLEFRKVISNYNMQMRFLWIPYETLVSPRWYSRESHWLGRYGQYLTVTLMYRMPDFFSLLVGGGDAHHMGSTPSQPCPCGCAVTLSTKFMEQYTKLETQLLLLQKYVLGELMELVLRITNTLTHANTLARTQTQTRTHAHTLTHTH